LPNAGVIETAADVVTIAAAVPNEIVPAEVLPISKFVAGMLVAVVSPNVVLLRELWKGDTVLLTGVAVELGIASEGAFAKPLNTDVVGAEVDDPKVGAIEGKATVPKVVVVDGVVVTSGTFLITVWPPNIGVVDNEVGA